MQIEEVFQVPAALEAVWDFIIDPHRMAGCLPSVASVEVQDANRYTAVVKERVGVISATFRIETEVVSREAPLRIAFANKGKTIAGAAGTLRSADTITLSPLPGGATEVCVRSDLTLGGPLAVLGAKLIQTKARAIFAEAAARMAEQLGGIPARPAVALGDAAPVPAS